MKKRLLFYLPVCVLIVAVAVVYILVIILANPASARIPRSNLASCKSIGQLHRVTIRNNIATPANTDATICDRLTITNDDPVVRMIAFGNHSHHIVYDGATEKVLDQDESFSVILNQKGAYKFHDHLDDAVQGTFNVR